MTDAKHLIIVPHSLQQLFLKLAHEDSGHQGVERTLSRLSDVAYWVDMAKSASHHCKVCMCQVSAFQSTSTQICTIAAHTSHQTLGDGGGGCS